MGETISDNFYVLVVCQAAVLLESEKATTDVVADLSSSCFKLNSLQLRALLQNYKPARDELQISPELLERAVLVAQNTADAIARREGSEVKLLEDLDLQLPFLLPEDGYSCDFVTGCNAELVAFLEPLRQAGNNTRQVSGFVLYCIVLESVTVNRVIFMCMIFSRVG